MKRISGSAASEGLSEVEIRFVLEALALVQNEATRYALTLQFEQACRAAAWLEQAAERRVAE